MLNEMPSARVDVLMNMEIMNDNIVLRWWLNKYSWTKKKKNVLNEEKKFYLYAKKRIDWIEIWSERKTKIKRRKEIIFCVYILFLR
jgi:hypothetical protein